MPLKVTDPILGKREIDPDEILQRLNRPDAKDRAFAQAVMTWTRVAGVDPALVFAMWLLETDNGQSIRWNRDLNASGMGIVSDGTAQPFKITSVDESVRLFVQCLYSLVKRKAHPEIPLDGDVLRWFNRVWLPKVQSRAMPDVRTVVDLGKRYTENGDSRATWSWEDGKVPESTYGYKLTSRLKQFYPNLPSPSDPPVETPSTPEEPTLPTPEQIKPTFIDAPVRKDRDRQGFNYGARGPIVGLVIHETQGRGSGDWYQQFFSCPNGERCNDALVDWLIDRDGKLWEYQDPYTSNRIPWAAGGPENNSNAIGKAINAKYRGVFGGINKVYASVEMVKTDAEALTQAQIRTAGKLLAYVMAKAGYPANNWRYPDTLGGNIYTAPHHSDASQTSCRIGDSDKAAIEAVCTQELTAYYGGTTPAPDPPPPPEPEIVPGVDWGIAKRAFDNPALPGYVLTKGGPLSTLYLERVKTDGVLPQLTERWPYDDGRVYYRFGNGWLALFTEKDKQIRWIDAEAA